MAASYRKILERSFPGIDVEISDYIAGLLEDSGDDFETKDELYEAIGGMLAGLRNDDAEDQIHRLCARLFTLMKDGSEDSSQPNGPVKILDAPVRLGEMEERPEQELQNIFMVKRDESMLMTVNQKKLEKAEKLIKQKQEKRAQQEALPTKTNGYEPQLATASQQINKQDIRLDASGTNRSSDIRIDNFDVSFGDRVLLQNADLLMASGRRYGLVGRNGIGKTTLLRMIASKSLRIPSHLSVLHVEQEVVGDDTLALQSVLECLVDRERLLQEEKDINATLQSSSPSENNLSGRLHEIYQALEEMEADKAPAKAALILAGLGFSPAMQRQPTREFSGGWRMRLALARALFSKPDLLLLDEPTNMLDMKAIIWLENYLQTWLTTILVVSHDRDFLNHVVTDVLHLTQRRLEPYKGDYEVFAKTRAEKLKNQQREFEAQKQYRDHIQVFIDRFRYNANRASQVQSKLKMLEKLPELVPVEKDAEVTLKFPECEKLSPPILQLDELTFYWSPSRVLFNKVDICAAMDSRICIVGENGAGKTTLLKILLGELAPVSGVRHAHRSLRIGYFSQHHVDHLDLNLNSVEVLAKKFPGRTSEEYRNKLGSFGVTGELALRPVVSLSGGQKSRVAFAQMSMSNPNFFVLDEPTNHLDMETIEALGAALNKFEGGVILVSHDARLIRLICKELWVCENSKVRSLEGGIEEYRKVVEAELAAQAK